MIRRRNESNGDGPRCRRLSPPVAQSGALSGCEPGRLRVCDDARRAAPIAKSDAHLGRSIDANSIPKVVQSFKVRIVLLTGVGNATRAIPRPAAFEGTIAREPPNPHGRVVVKARRRDASSTPADVNIARGSIVLKTNFGVDPNFEPLDGLRGNAATGFGRESGFSAHGHCH